MSEAPTDLLTECTTKSPVDFVLHMSLMIFLGCIIVSCIYVCRKPKRKGKYVSVEVQTEWIIPAKSSDSGFSTHSQGFQMGHEIEHDSGHDLGHDLLSNGVYSPEILIADSLKYPFMQPCALQSASFVSQRNNHFLSRPSSNAASPLLSRTASFSPSSSATLKVKRPLRKSATLITLPSHALQSIIDAPNNQSTVDSNRAVSVASMGDAYRSIKNMFLDSETDLNRKEEIGMRFAVKPADLMP